MILVDDVHAETVRLVNFAKSLDHPWHAVHIAVNPDKVRMIREKWNRRIGEGELVIILSPTVCWPILCASTLRNWERTPGSFIHIIMGHLAMDTFWEQALHQNSAVMFNLALSRMEHVVVTSVPYQIHRDGLATHAPKRWMLTGSKVGPAGGCMAEEFNPSEKVSQAAWR